MIGETLSHFRILEKLGEGGMGVVYRAVDERLGRKVALKVLQPGAVGNEERRLRFIREARTAASISHPHIATVHEIDETAAGTVFIAMELVEGRTLAELLEEGPLSQREALRFAIEIAEALGRAHELGIVHRDLKPENVMVRSDRHVKILDFGLAKLREVQQTKPRKRTTPNDRTLSMNVTRDGRVMGTANYMSPEQARGFDVDTRSDLFSFGILLYETLTGRKPFESETVTDTLAAIIRDSPVPPTVIAPTIPRQLEQLIFKCLAKDAGDRYQQADEIAAELRQIRIESDSLSLTGHSLTAVQPPPAPRRSRVRGVVIAAGVLLFALALLSLRTLVARDPAEVPARAPDGLRAVAVMPLENLTDAAETRQLGRILQELIITELSGIESLRVFSSQRLYDLRKQLPEGDPETIDSSVATRIARDAGAEAMLTGSLSQLGERWILTAQLVDLEDGSVIKSERIDGSDLYAMVDDLTSRIRDDLGVSEDVRLTSVREKTTDSIDAWRHYVEGVQQLDRGNRAEAARQLERAVTIDPAFGQAYIKLAVAKWWSQDQGMYPGGGEPTSPARVLDRLLSGEIKLSAKERRLAEALHPLVAYDYRRAAPLFEALVEAHPDEKEAWYGLGEALRHSPGGGRDSKAVAAFERALDLDPNFGVAYVHVEEHYMGHGMHEEAIRKVRLLIGRTHGAPDWNLVLARWLLRQGKDDEANELARRSLAEMAQPEARIDATMMLAQTLATERGDVAGAAQLLEGAAALGVESREARVRTSQGQLARWGGDYPTAEARFRRALEIDPVRNDALFGLFMTLWDEAAYTKAIEEARDRLAEHEHRPLYHYWIESAFLADDTEERERAIAQALERSKTPEEQRWVWLTAAGAASDLGDAVAAEAWLRRADEMKLPDDGLQLAMAHLRCALEQDRAEEGLVLLSRALEKFPDEPEWLMNMAWVQLDLGRFELAGQHAQAVLDSNRSHPGAWGSLIVKEALEGNRDPAPVIDSALEAVTAPADRLELERQIARAYVVMNSWPTAEVHARRAASSGESPERTGGVRLLALILAQQGRHGEARELLAHALAERPHDAKLQQAQAAVELQAGRGTEAEEILRGILANGPKQRAVIEALAYALAAQGDFVAAEREARRALGMARGRSSLTLLAWVLVAGEKNLDEGVRLAEEARAIPAMFAERAAPAYEATPEHTLAVAHMKRGEWSRAVALLEQAASTNPQRGLIREHLAESRARL